jgi:hypothetical protein
LAIATFLQLLRPQTLDDQRALRVYRTHVDAMCSHVRDVFEAWVTLREIEPDYARLANTSAVNRWELMRLANQAERLQPPRTLGGVHRNLLAAVTASARACQLLANGYRFYKSEAICDGQALLVETVQDLDELLLQVNTR